jgi:hypothetical protein
VVALPGYHQFMEGTKMPDRLATGDFHWADSDAPDGPRAGQAPRNAILPWFDNTWIGPAGGDARPVGAGFSELPLLVGLVILGSGLPLLVIMGVLALELLLFTAIGRRPVEPGVVRSLIWLYRPLVVGELLVWYTTWGTLNDPGWLGTYAMIVLAVWLLIAGGRLVWAHTHH